MCVYFHVQTRVPSLSVSLHTYRYYVFLFPMYTVCSSKDPFTILLALAVNTNWFFVGHEVLDTCTNNNQIPCYVVDVIDLTGASFLLIPHWLYWSDKSCHFLLFSFV